jgi:hypothetical protein
MTRRIVTTQLDAATPAVVDGYFDKLLKYIPGDIIAAWIAASGLIAGASDTPQSAVLWVAFLILLVLSFFWTLRLTAMPNKPPAITQSALSSVSFLVWVFALGGPFATLSFYRPVYGSLVLILYTVVVPLINPGE